MYEFHKDKKRYFQWQYDIGQKWVIPFIEESGKIKPSSRVLEIGCAEAGVLKAFIDKGCEGIGIELNENRVRLARKFLSEDIKKGKVEIISSNIYDIDPIKDNHQYDLIILKDVIEHIFDQEKFLKQLGSFLLPGGRVFFGFPPWQMPFGGHQQICSNRVLKVLPYFHLLPRSIYKWVIKITNERPSQLQELIEIKETGISIERFESITKNAGFNIKVSQHFLINPIYEKKFGLTPRKQLWVIRKVPYLRNFLTTAVYYLIAKEQEL